MGDVWLGSIDDIVNIVVGSFVGAGVGIGGDIGLAAGLEVFTVVGGTLLGLGNGIRAGTVVVGSLVGVGVGADNDFELGLGGMDGVPGGFRVGTVVVGILFGLDDSDSIIVRVCDGLGNNAGFELGVRVLDQFVEQKLGAVYIVVCGTIVVISLDGQGVG